MLIQSSALSSLANALRSGECDLLKYIEDCCTRLETIDPQIQAFLPERDRRDRLRREALALQTRYTESKDRPPLYGVLVGVKDLYRLDGFPTKAGSALPPDLFAGPEASMVTMLKTHGALVLGKTITTEFAYSEPGPTRNPHNLEHTPGGSSSGSAAAVAAGMCALALGTQTGGSVIRPAAFCGIVGFKPSFGRIATDGMIPFSPSLDHAGFFTQDVPGAQLVASILLRDWQATAPDDKAVRRLAVPDGKYLDQASAIGRAAFESQLNRLEASGFHIERIAILDDIEAIRDYHTQLTSGEVAKFHQPWFADCASLYRPRTAALIRQGQMVSEQSMSAARMTQADLRNRLESAMQQADIDLWVSPAAPGPAPLGISSTGDPIMNLPWTMSGLPTITLPAGTTPDGLPIGLQCSGRFNDDERVLSWAASLANALS